VTRSNKADFSVRDFIATDVAREYGVSAARTVMKPRGKLNLSTIAESYSAGDVRQGSTYQEQKATQKEQTSNGVSAWMFLFACEDLNENAFQMLRLANDETKKFASECFESVKTLAGVIGSNFEPADHEQEKKDETIMGTASKMIHNLKKIGKYKLEDDVKRQIQNVFGCIDKICREQHDRITASTDCWRLIRVAERTEALTVELAKYDYKSTTAFATKLAASMQTMLKLVRTASIAADAHLSKWDHKAVSFYKDDSEFDATDKSKMMFVEDRIKDELTKIRVCACRQSDSRILSALDQALALVEQHSVELDKEMTDELYS